MSLTSGRYSRCRRAAGRERTPAPRTRTSHAHAPGPHMHQPRTRTWPAHAPATHTHQPCTRISHTHAPGPQAHLTSPPSTPPPSPARSLPEKGRLEFDYVTWKRGLEASFRFDLAYPCDLFLAEKLLQRVQAAESSAGDDGSEELRECKLNDEPLDPSAALPSTGILQAVRESPIVSKRRTPADAPHTLRRATRPALPAVDRSAHRDRVLRCAWACRARVTGLLFDAAARRAHLRPRARLDSAQRPRDHIALMGARADDTDGLVGQRDAGRRHGELRQLAVPGRTRRRQPHGDVLCAPRHQAVRSRVRA